MPLLARCHLDCDAHPLDAVRKTWPHSHLNDLFPTTARHPGQDFPFFGLRRDNPNDGSSSDDDIDGATF
jgi:hypothetical protein